MCTRFLAISNTLVISVSILFKYQSFHHCVHVVIIITSKLVEEIIKFIK